MSPCPPKPSGSLPGAGLMPGSKLVPMGLDGRLSGLGLLPLKPLPVAHNCRALPRGQRAGQPGGASSHPFLWDVSWDVRLMGLSCGRWKPLSRPGAAVAALCLPSPSFPSSPPPVCIQRLKNKPLTPLTLPLPALQRPPCPRPPGVGPLEAGALSAEWAASWV